MKLINGFEEKSNLNQNDFWKKICIKSTILPLYDRTIQKIIWMKIQIFEFQSEYWKRSSSFN